MENVFIAVTISFGAAAAAIFVAIVRDAWPHLSADQHYALQHHFKNSTIRQLRAGDKAIGQAWKTHVEVFPRSRKRLLFGVLVIFAALSIMAYPLWMALR